LLEIINRWWKEESFPEDLFYSEIILIFKKADNSKIENYRPIALLNALYKNVAALVKKRLAWTLDKHLQNNSIRL